MSTSQRYVAVKLIDGKKYVLRNGRHVTIRENPHWQCRVNYPFAVIQGPDFVVYYDEEGNTGGGTPHEHDIMRPVYEPGEVYVGRDGRRHKIERDDNDDNYPLENDYQSWTRDGRCFGTTYNDHDLMDYEQLPSVYQCRFAPPPAPVVDVDTGITTASSIVQDALPDLATLEAFVAPSRVGMRVEVQIDCPTTVQATIMYEDAAYIAIEFDPDYYHAGAWTCDGHVPSGRGWYVPKDSVRAVSEAETQVEAERSEPEALNGVDVAEVWAAYRSNPSISIDVWIAARLELKAAAK